MHRESRYFASASWIRHTCTASRSLVADLSPPGGGRGAADRARRQPAERARAEPGDWGGADDGRGRGHRPQHPAPAPLHRAAGHAERSRVQLLFSEKIEIQEL